MATPLYLPTALGPSSFLSWCLPPLQSPLKSSILVLDLLRVFFFFASCISAKCQPSGLRDYLWHGNPLQPHPLLFPAPAVPTPNPIFLQLNVFYPLSSPEMAYKRSVTHARLDQQKFTVLPNAHNPQHTKERLRMRTGFENWALHIFSGIFGWVSSLLSQMQNENSIYFVL